jgi:RNA polymerase sigma factor for flagellar operon FliA
MAAETSRTTPVREPTSEDIARYIPLVHQVVRRVLRRLPSNVRREDLFSAGMFGLYDSIRKNGSDEGPKFEWYARIRIRGAILDELRAQDWLPRRARWVAAGRRAPSPGATNLPSAVVGFDDLGAGELASQLADTSTLDSGAQIELRSDCESLVAAIDQLPERERTIVRLHYFEGVRFKEIGALLGVSEPRISQLHARAIGRLKTMMEAAEQAA